MALLGHDVVQASVVKYMVRFREPPSQTWRTFLANHVEDIAACDFFTVPTVTFRVLYVFIVLRHDRRRIVQFNATTDPYAPSKSSMPSRTRKHLVFSFAIETTSTIPTSPDVWKA